MKKRNQEKNMVLHVRFDQLMGGENGPWESLQSRKERARKRPTSVKNLPTQVAMKQVLRIRIEITATDQSLRDQQTPFPVR